MDRKRRYIILGVISVVLITLIVICSTVFTVKDIRINFLEEPSSLTSKSVYTQIVNTKSVSFGKSVFAYNKDESTKQIEKNVPYLKVVNLEIEFPNILSVNCVERKECAYFSITNSIGMYAICDKEGKVLRTSNGEIATLTKLELESSISDVLIGSFIQDDTIDKFVDLFMQFEYISTLGAGANSFFKSMTIEDRTSTQEGVYDIKCITRDNITFNFIKANELLVEKLEEFLKVYGYSGSENQISANSVVDIYADSQGNIKAEVTN